VNRENRSHFLCFPTCPQEINRRPFGSILQVDFVFYRLRAFSKKNIDKILRADE
jgi:hypothetical protein